jgi:hypothetical protein
MVARMIRLTPAAVGLVLAACGASGGRGAASAAGANAPAPPGCDALRADADTASAALTTCRGAIEAPEWAHRASFRWLEEHIDARLEAARAGEGEATTVVEAQEIAEHVWSLLDEVSSELADAAIRDRTEDAAEALLRDREAEARARAFAALGSALATLRAAIEPPREARCEEEERAAAAAWMNAQAACTPLD